MKIYLDTSVYNRPFDDQAQPRIWLESVSFSMILQLIETQKIELVTSSVIFMIAAIFSPKRKVKGWQQKLITEELSD